MGSYVYDQAKAISESNRFDVQIIKVVSLFSKERSYVFKEFNVQIFKVIDFPFFIFPGFFNVLNTFRINRFFKKNKFFLNLSVIHAHVCYPAAYLTNALVLKKGIKTIAQHHGLDAFQLQNGRFDLFKKIQRSFLLARSIRVLNNIDLNVSVSRKVQSELHLFEDYMPKYEFVLYNGVDTTKFYKTIQQDHENYKIGCVANFWIIKDHISLLKAIKLLLDDGIKIELKLVGYGKTLELCKQYVLDNNLQDNVEFILDVTHDQLNSFYNEIDLFVLPSYYEALGCVYLEAWATGTPFIAIKDQGIMELLPELEKESLLAEKQSPDSLKEKILGEYHKKRVFHFDKQYDIKNTISDFLKNQLFNDV